MDWLDKLIQDNEIFEQENLKFKEELERRRYEIETDWLEPLRQDTERIRQENIKMREETEKLRQMNRKLATISKVDLVEIVKKCTKNYNEGSK